MQLTELGNNFLGEAAASVASMVATPLHVAISCSYLRDEGVILIILHMTLPICATTAGGLLWSNII